VITSAATPPDHVIEMTRAISVALVARSLSSSPVMRTIQVSVGELIEAMYAELVETYGDRELALVAAQALGDELLARFGSKAMPASDAA